MAPLSTTPSHILSPRYYSYYEESASYYRGRTIGLIIGSVVFVLLLVWYITYLVRKNKRSRSVDIAFASHVLPPPPYTGPPGQEPTWNGTQWQGPRNADGSPGPCWNGMQWAPRPGPVWNGRVWVQAGQVNGVYVPTADTGRVWNGTAWVGPGAGANMGTRQEEGVPGNTDWYQRDKAAEGMAPPMPVFVKSEQGRRESWRDERSGVNPDGGVGHAATQSRDFGADAGANVDATMSGGVVAPPAATAGAPEIKEEKKVKGVKGWFK